MLNYILHNLDRYPLDGVVHFELEIDYPFIHNVIDYMETECKRAGIQFVRIKPRKTWEELYDKCGFPTRKIRWCNGHYKLDAKRQLSKWLNEVGFYVVHYIGYCADEERRFNKRLSAKKLEIYPLAENGINEDVILEWAKTQPIFNNYYKTNKRCGCMYCPMSSYLNFAYLYKYYPENFRYMLEKMRETEELREKELGRPFSVISSNPKYNADYLEHIVKTKWLKKLNEMLNITLRNFMDDMKIEDMNREDLHDLCGSFRFLLSKRCPIAYSANYSEYLKDVKEQGIKDYADEIVALYTLVEQYKKY